MRKFKKFVAFGLATALVMAPAATMAAEETSGSSTGDSYLEGVMPSDVTSIVLPTIAEGTYKTILDPSHLLSTYDENKDNYESGASVLFPVANSKYASTSQLGTAVNKSTCDVKLAVNVEVTNVATNPVTFVAKDAVESDTNRNVYMGLVPTAVGTVVGTATATAGAATAAQAIAVNTEGKAEATFLLEGDTDNFDIKQAADATVKSGHKYTYVAKDDASWNTAGFGLTATCNTKADWVSYNEKSQLTTGGENLAVEVVYEMTALTDDEKAQLTGDDAISADATTGLIEFASDTAPTGFASGATFTMTVGDSTSTQLAVNLGNGTLASTISSIDVLTSEDAAIKTLVENTEYTLADGNKITLTAGEGSVFGVAVAGSYKIKVTLADGSTFVAPLTVSAAE